MYDVVMQDGYRTTLAASNKTEVVRIIRKWFGCSSNDIKYIKRR